MPPPFWLQCNVCSLSYSSDVKFYLLSCGHTLCRGCLAKKTAHGKVCPIDHKSIKFEELQKLPDNLKNLFKLNPSEELDKTLKVFDFQKRQMDLLFTRDVEMKSKLQRALQVQASMKQKVKDAQIKYEQMKKRRIEMQAKLKEIYFRNQKKHSSQVYRDPCPSTLSSGSTIASKFFSTPGSVSTAYRPSSTAKSSGSGSGSSFFNQDAPMLQRPLSSQSSQCYHSSRKPFFN